jgi:hypothetical protein
MKLSTFFEWAEYFKLEAKRQTESLKKASGNTSRSAPSKPVKRKR